MLIVIVNMTSRGIQELNSRQPIGQLGRFVDQDRKVLRTNPEIFSLILKRQ